LAPLPKKAKPAVAQKSKVMAVLSFKPFPGDAKLTALGEGLVESEGAKLGRLSNDQALEIIPASCLEEKRINSLEDARRQFGIECGTYDSRAVEHPPAANNDVIVILSRRGGLSVRRRREDKAGHEGDARMTRVSATSHDFSSNNFCCRGTREGSSAVGANYFSGQSSCRLSLVDGQLSVDENVLHSYGVGERSGKCGGVGDFIRIEQNKVRR